MRELLQASACASRDILGPASSVQVSAFSSSRCACPGCLSWVGAEQLPASNLAAFSWLHPTRGLLAS